MLFRSLEAAFAPTLRAFDGLEFDHYVEPDTGSILSKKLFVRINPTSCQRRKSSKTPYFNVNVENEFQ